MIKNEINQLYVRWPQGSGGHWLSTLIDNIYTQNLDHQSGVDFINFHSKKKKINPLYSSGHSVKDSKDIVFGGPAGGFNFFLNFWWKKRIFENYIDFNTQSDYQKLNVLAEEARWILFGKEYKSQYCDNLSIDWSWIWHDAARFKKTIFELFPIIYHKEYDYIIDLQLLNYKKSCVDPKYHLGNPFSLPWISWCYAIIIEQDLNTDYDIKTDKDVILLSRYIQNNTKKFLDTTMPRVTLFEDI